MKRHDQTVSKPEGCAVEVREPRKLHVQMGKEEWIQHYANRMLTLWLKWQTRLGVAWEYMEQLKVDLAELYEEPLKRMFIETTY
jgi:hypothetical protein